MLMCVLEQTPRTITVRISNSRWSRLMELEHAYRIARSVVKAKKEVNSAPSMSIDEAMNFIDTL